MKSITINYEKLKNNREWNLLCESIYKEGVYIKSYQVRFFTIFFKVFMGKNNYTKYLSHLIEKLLLANYNAI